MGFIGGLFSGSTRRVYNDAQEMARQQMMRQMQAIYNPPDLARMLGGAWFESPVSHPSPSGFARPTDDFRGPSPEWKPRFLAVTLRHFQPGPPRDQR